MRQSRKFNFAERIMLQHAYLPKLILDLGGVVIAAYYLWQHSLVVALVALFGMSILGNIVAWKQDMVALSRTKLGKWMLVQADPVNLIVRSIGGIVVGFGIWYHAPAVILSGNVLILGRQIARIVSKRRSRSKR